MSKKRKRRELLSFDTAILLLAIIALFVILKTAFSPIGTIKYLEETKEGLENDAEIVLNTLSDRNAEVSLVESNELIEEKIERLDKKDYDEIKNILGVKNDFCIFFEDTTGNVVKIKDINPGIGSDKIYVNGRPCR